MTGRAHERTESGKGPGMKELTELGRHALHAADAMVELAAIQRPAVEEVRHILARLQKEKRRLTAGESEAIGVLLKGLDESSCRIEETMRGVLDFGKGKIFTFAKVSINDVLLKLKERVKNFLGQDAVIFYYELCPKLSEQMCLVDQYQLADCIFSMIENAIEGGAKQITMATSIDTTPEGQFVEISITNDGREIPSADLKKIFNLSFTTKKKGNGVGLAMAQRIVEAHKGRIDVRSTCASTAFRLYLPL